MRQNCSLIFGTNGSMLQHGQIRTASSDQVVYSWFKPAHPTSAVRAPKGISNMVAKNDSKVHLTPKGKKKLEEELEHLRTTGRDEIRQFMTDVMEEGDISENSGYDDARAKMGALESRIFELEGLLSRAIVIEESEAEVVTVGSVVTIDVKIGTRDEFTIVGTHEAEPLKGRISDESPIGKAMLGKRKGGSVEFNGKKFKIKNIRFE